MHLQTYIFVPIHTHATLCIQNTTCFGLAILKCNMNLSLPHPAVTPAQSCFPSGPSPSCSWGSELCNRAPQILSFSTEFLSGLDLFLEHGSQAVRKGCLLSGTLLALNLRSLVFYDQSPSWLEERRMAEGHPPPPQYHIQMLKRVWWIMKSPLSATQNFLSIQGNVPPLGYICFVWQSHKSFNFWSLS